MDAAIHILSKTVGGAICPVIIWCVYREYTAPRANKYLTFWPRFWTGAVDDWALSPLGQIFALSYFARHGWALAAVALVVQNLATWVYSIGMHAAYGQTLGKMACKVRVVDSKTEGPITFLQALLRDSIPLAIALITVIYTLSHTQPGNVISDPDKKLIGPDWLDSLAGTWFLIEVITMFTNQKRRALHDFIAGTVVIRTQVAETGPSEWPHSYPALKPVDAV